MCRVQCQFVCVRCGFESSCALERWQCVYASGQQGDRDRQTDWFESFHARTSSRTSGHQTVKDSWGKLLSFVRLLSLSTKVAF